MRHITWLSMIAIAIMAVGAFTSKSETLLAAPTVSINVMEMQNQAGPMPVMVIENLV
jgi:hypothetical protein